MLKRRIIENVIAFMLFATLMIAGTDTIETIHDGILHALVDIGIDRTASEMVSACTVLWAVVEFSRNSVKFFSAELYLLKDKK